MLRARLYGVRCPSCSDTDSRVIDSRAAEDGGAIRRRRECVACGARFTTFERVESAPLMVVKRSGPAQVFDGDKLVAGLMAACKGRPLSREQFEEMALDIEEAGRSLGAEITSEWIGLQVLEHLRRCDPVAYLRFASVYKGFNDLDDFEREARLIKITSPADPAGE